VIMLVVHPRYWRRGHGTRLSQWGIDMSREDGVSQCVSAAGMGRALYRSLGFQDITEILASGGDDSDLKGVKTHLMRYEVEASLSTQLN
jgi:GNAT superfamily N-acetyltransferase